MPLFFRLSVSLSYSFFHCFEGSFPWTISQYSELEVLVSHLCSKFMLAYIYHAIFRVGGEVGGLFEIFSISCKNFCCCWENVWKDFKRKQYSLKVYITMKYKFILHGKNIVRVTCNQPPIPCFKPHKTWSLPTNLRLLLHVVLVFSNFLTGFSLIFRGLFRYCGARGKFLTLKDIVIALWSCFTHKQTVWASGDPHKPVIS